MALTAILLGAAAGGGFPQWNCRCRVCSLAWQGDPRAPRRTQASLAVSADGVRFAVIDAAPELREQVLATPALHPRGPRESPIEAVVVTSGDVDRIAGLLSLRERQPFDLWAAADVLAEIEASPVFRVLAPERVARRTLPRGPFEALPGLLLEAFPVAGKIPLYREATGQSAAEREGVVTALRITAPGSPGAVVWAPGCAVVDDRLTGRLDAQTTLLLDGTVFVDDEMIREGVGEKTGRRMGHAPVTGEGGSLPALAGVALARRIYVHVNNTNPILVEGSPERRLVEAAGWEVGTDGMEIAP